MCWSGSLCVCSLSICCSHIFCTEVKVKHLFGEESQGLQAKSRSSFQPAVKTKCELSNFGIYFVTCPWLWAQQDLDLHRGTWHITLRYARDHRALEMHSLWCIYGALPKGKKVELKQELLWLYYFFLGQNLFEANLWNSFTQESWSKLGKENKVI